MVRVLSIDSGEYRSSPHSPSGLRMMRQGDIQQIRTEVDAALAAMREGRKEDAGLHLWWALDSLGEVRDPRGQRELLRRIAHISYAYGFDDLSLMAGQDAIETDERLGDVELLATDLLSYANVHSRLGNLEEAEETYRTVLKRTLEDRNFADAASASTNLAQILAKNGYVDEAIQCLEKSLQYLESEAFPEIEMETRFTLVQVLEVAKRDPSSTMDAARALLDRFAGQLPEAYLDVVSRFVGKAIERQAEAHPEIDSMKFRMRRFPELYGS